MPDAGSQRCNEQRSARVTDALVEPKPSIDTHDANHMPSPSTGPALNRGRPAAGLAAVICAALIAGCGFSDKPHGAAASGGPLLKYAQCMRSSGVPNFPDPTSSPPPPGNGNVIGGNGTYLAVGSPASQQSPAFKHAAVVCGIPGPP
jgi:hypothetical protein